jgi:capsular polysaccharide biosynthesis protein
MNTSHGPYPSGSGRRRSVPRRRWLIVPGLAALGLLVSAAYVVVGVAVVPQVYTAAVDVTLTSAGWPSQGIALIPGLVPDLHDQAQAVRSIGVAAIAGRMMHSGLSPQALTKKVTVTVPPNSWVLDIACAGPSAIRAATCADDFAKAYLQSSGRSAAKAVSAQVNTLRRAVTSLSRARATLRAKAAALPVNSPRRAADEAQLTSDHGRLRSFAWQVKAMTGELAKTSSGSIVTLATTPGKPGGPSKLPVLLSGSVAGLLVGVIAAFLLGRRDKRILDTRAT